MSADAPPDLIDAILLATIRRLEREAGSAGRVSVAALRRELGVLSMAAVRLALLGAERRGRLALLPAEGPAEGPPRVGSMSRIAAFWPGSGRHEDSPGGQGERPGGAHRGGIALARCGRVAPTRNWGAACVDMMENGEGGTHLVVLLERGEGGSAASSRAVSWLNTA